MVRTSSLIVSLDAADRYQYMIKYSQQLITSENSQTHTVDLTLALLGIVDARSISVMPEMSRCHEPVSAYKDSAPPGSINRVWHAIISWSTNDKDSSRFAWRMHSVDYPVSKIWSESTHIQRDIYTYVYKTGRIYKPA